jgi:hypothetical protein
MRRNQYQGRESITGQRPEYNLFLGPCSRNRMYVRCALALEKRLGQRGHQTFSYRVGAGQSQDRIPCSGSACLSQGIPVRGDSKSRQKQNRGSGENDGTGFLTGACFYFHQFVSAHRATKI